MSLRYCFEQKYVLRTLSASRKNDLAVIDTDGISTAAIKTAIVRIEEEEYNSLKEQLDEGDFPTDDSLDEEIIVDNNQDDEEPVVVQKTVAQILDEQIKLAAIFAEV